MLSSELVQSVLESAPDAIVIVDGTGAIAFTNRQVRINFGYEPEELLGHPVDWLLPTLEATEHLGAAVSAPGAPRARRLCAHRELAARRKDGSEFPVEVSLNPVYAAGHTLIATVIHDVTEQRQLQLELEKAHIHLQSAYLELKQFAAQAPIAMAMFDRDMHYIAASDRWTADYGRGRATLIGLNHYELYPDLPEPWREAHRRGQAGEFLKRDEELWNRPDGTHSWVRWAITPWRNDRGEIGGIIVLAEDVTGNQQVKELQRHIDERTTQLRALVAELEGTEFRERENLARDLHDDLGQLLAAARIRLLPLVQSTDPAVQATATALDALIARANSATRTLAANLAPAALHERGLGAALHSLAEDVERTFPIHIEVIEFGDPESLTDVTRSILYRAARELLINAAKHAKSDRATVEFEADGSDIVLRVIDDGIGLDPTVQVTAAPTGSGLATIRQRLRLIGGSFELLSRPGEGTTAVLRAPMREPPRPDGRTPTRLNERS